MQIIRFNVRIQIQKAIPSQDEIGNWDNQWDFAYGCYAAVDSRQVITGEQQVAGQQVDHSDLIFTIRYTPRLKDMTTTGYRILFKGNFYDIQRIDWMNFTQETIKIYAKKVER